MGNYHEPREINALAEWRTKVLNGILTIISIASFPAWLSTFLSSIKTPDMLFWGILFTIIFCSIVSITLFRKINYPVRSWGLIFFGYSAAISNLALAGLRSSGPIYLLTIPIIGFILLSPKAGILCSVFSVVLAGTFNGLFIEGILQPSGNFGINTWASFFTFFTLITIVSSLVLLYYRFQTGLIQKEKSARTELAVIHKKLEEQNTELEKKVKQRTRELNDIIEFLPDATLVIDQQGKVIAWNRAIEEMTGIKAEMILGKGDHEYALPFYGLRRPILIDLTLLPQKEFEEMNYVQIQRSGETLTGETYTPNLKNGARYLFAKATPLHDGKGNTIGAIETIRDITDRKKSEEELKQAKEVADSANQAKSAFLANMSHELRTPLNSIIGFTRIVRKKAEGIMPDKQIENLDKVLISSDHLLSLINTVLDIAKIEAGRMDILPANFRIGALMDLCYNTTQPLIKANVQLEKIVDDNLSTIFNDQDKIRQIILNLLSNAAKFTHSGKITLKAVKNKENLQVSVADTGIGISEEALTRIFKEFQQADASTTRQYGGTGLGLSISRKLAQLLGGDITVNSKLGEGSIFTLVIPSHYLGIAQFSRKEDNNQEEISRIKPDMASGQQITDSNDKIRILVIDDDPDAVYLLKETLHEESYDIIGEKTGEEGIKTAKKINPHVIFLDVVMPGINGWQVLHTLKNDPATSHIPVIFLTVLEKKALGIELGAFDYLMKPLNPYEVERTLSRIASNNKNRKIQVQIIDDDPNVIELLNQLLPEEEFEINSALNAQNGLGMIAKKMPDILLLDLLMPQMDGFEVIERLGQDGSLSHLPIIVISGKELSQTEKEKLNDSYIKVMKKQGLAGLELISEIHNVLHLKI